MHQVTQAVMLDKRVDSRGMRMPVSSEPSTVVPDLPRPGGVSSEKARAENHFAGAYQADDRYAGVSVPCMSHHHVSALPLL